MVLVIINKEEIDNANGKCPVTSFFETAFPGFKVKVLRTSVQIFPKRGNKGLYGKLPYEAVDFLTNWDNKQNKADVCMFFVDLKK